MCTKTVLLTAGVCVLLAACGGEPLRVGSKGFTEQKILGEMIAQVAHNAGIPITRGIPYGGSQIVFEGIKQNKLDTYPAYTGTALVLLGQPPITNADKAYRRVAKLYKPLGLSWRRRFGFSNNYVLVMRAEQAHKLGVKTISDLATVSAKLRFAMPKEFPTRPRDGMAALARRYGLKTQNNPILDDNTRTRYAALSSGKADVVVGFSTDGQLASGDLRVLEDDANFFPVYQPAPLVRDAVLKRYPQLADALDKLGNTINEKTMRRLNAAVTIEGKDYRAVAHNFLVSRDLIAGNKQAGGTNPVTLAVDALQSKTEFAHDALRAAQQSFTGRSVVLLPTASPMDALKKGKARMALVSADAFYQMQGDQPVQTDRAVAIAHMGFHYAHILAPVGMKSARFADLHSLAVPAANDESAHMARFVLAGLGLGDQIKLVAPDRPTVQATAQLVSKGRADAMMVVAPEGDPGISALMRSGDFRLAGIERWNQGNNALKFAFLRNVKLATDSYANVPSPVPTLGAQTVLAGPAPSGAVVGDAGPATGAPPDNPNPIAVAVVKNINSALGNKADIDPVLPRAAGLTPPLPDLNESINPSVAVSVTNFLVIVVIVYLFYLFIREGSYHGRR